MQFNSIYFALFFPIVFLLYWFAFNKDLKKQNVFLVLVSFFFFACFDWRFLFLLQFSILLDYFIAIKIFDSISNKKKWLWLSIGVNICFLGFFKYFNFFIDNFSELISLFGFKANIWTLKIILPIGISFYTFHGLSYVIDVYNNKLKPVKSIIDYSLFVSFFPLLVAGPIERATHLLPQIQKKRVFDYSKSVDGLRQILWGLVKKVVIADGCAQYVDMIFENPTDYSASTLILGSFLFSFQIYGDFSGYSDIALGIARLLGIELLQNFSFPYFSRDIAEFWRRWHISLSSWFKDYVYIPLGGSRGTKLQSIRNVFLVFLLSGFWHGANWTFLVYGIINFLYFLPLLIFNRNRDNKESIVLSDFGENVQTFFKIGMTFLMVSLARVFFRSETIADSFLYLRNIFSKTILNFPEIFPKTVLGLIFLFLLIEWNGRKNFFAIEKFGFFWNRSLRLSFYFILSCLILYNAGKEVQFIYFQF